MYVIAWFAQRQVQDQEDFIVAGRRLPLSLAWMTLLATWFGAGTMLTAADEVRADGLKAAALDPFGAGFCLIAAGFFVAGPLWRMKLLTVPDFFRRRFGEKAELVSSLILIPSYFGWIAAQFTALAGVLELYFDIPIFLGIILVAIVGTGYTLLGGMWSVTLTDAIQISLVVIGLLVLSFVVLSELGEGSSITGVRRLVTESSPEKLEILPRGSFRELVGWLGVFVIGAFGNLPGQDLMQRVFAAKSARVAQFACLIAGMMYLVFGAMPLILALSGDLLLGEQVEDKIIPALAAAFLHPVVAVIFMVALLSAILSTIDSAILSPASVLSQNVIPKLGWRDSLKSNRVSVTLVALCSVVLAYAGESAYALLEEAYLLTLVGLFVPLMLGLYTNSKSAKAALASMISGVVLWGIHFSFGWEMFLEPVWGFNKLELPISLAVTSCSLLAFFVFSPPWSVKWGRSTESSSDVSD